MRLPPWECSRSQQWEIRSNNLDAAAQVRVGTKSAEAQQLLRDSNSTPAPVAEALRSLTKAIEQSAAAQKSVDSGDRDVAVASQAVVRQWLDQTIGDIEKAIREQEAKQKTLF